MKGEKPGSDDDRDRIVGYIIGPVFVLVALWFLFGPDTSVPAAEPVTVDRSAITSVPLRTVMTDPPTMRVAGFDKNCMDCHQLFRSPPEAPVRLNQHRNIVQAHGMNDRCYNCHDIDNRSTLVLPGGETIPFGEASRLCATCHGTTWRDWQSGMHGRTTGSWIAGDERHRRMTCTECHDPHAPAFDPDLAWPGPNTLRMGEPRDAEPGHGKRNPLRQWSSGHAGGNAEATGEELPY